MFSIRKSHNPSCLVVPKNSSFSLQIPHLQRASSQIKDLIKYPARILQSTKDVFGQLLPGNDEVLDSLRQNIPSPVGMNLQSMLTKCLEAFDVVLDRQLEPELTGKLSSLSPALQDQAKSAPVHNIYAERAFGRLGALKRKAPNSSDGFVNATLTAGANHTVDWLEKKDKPIQEDLVKCAISDGARIREEALRFKEYLDEEERIRLAIQGNNKKKTNTNKLNKPVLQAIANKTTEDVIFRDLASCQLQTVHALLVHDEALRGNLIIHLFFDKKEGRDQRYYGRIVEQRIKRKKSEILITYWKDQEDEDDGVDEVHPLSNIIVDLIVGDFVVV